MGISIRLCSTGIVKKLVDAQAEREGKVLMKTLYLEVMPHAARWCSGQA